LRQRSNANFDSTIVGGEENDGRMFYIHIDRENSCVAKLVAPDKKNKRTASAGRSSSSEPTTAKTLNVSGCRRTETGAAFVSQRGSEEKKVRYV
jgi:hypothetical protein